MHEQFLEEDTGERDGKVIRHYIVKQLTEMKDVIKEYRDESEFPFEWKTDDVNELTDRQLMWVYDFITAVDYI